MHFSQLMRAVFCILFILISYFNQAQNEPFIMTQLSVPIIYWINHGICIMALTDTFGLLKEKMELLSGSIPQLLSGMN